MGIPNSGKTTLATRLAHRYGITYLHSSEIIMRACPGAWVSRGEMAPEPCATNAVLAALDLDPEWVLDGFPRSERQIRLVRFVPVIYLAVTHRQAIWRATGRARMPVEIEAHRIRQQTTTLAPVKAMAACVIQTGWRTPDEVYRAAVEWLEEEKQPRETP